MDPVFDNNVFGSAKSHTRRKLPARDEALGDEATISTSKRRRLPKDWPPRIPFDPNGVPRDMNGEIWDHGFGGPGSTSDAQVPSRPAASVRSSNTTNTFRPPGKNRERRDPAAQSVPGRTRRIHAEKEDRQRALEGFDGPAQDGSTASVSARGTASTTRTSPGTDTFDDIPPSKVLSGKILNAQTPAFVPRKPDDDTLIHPTQGLSDEKSDVDIAIVASHAENDDHVEQEAHTAKDNYKTPANGPIFEAGSTEDVLVVHNDSYAKVLSKSNHTETPISPSIAQVGKVQCIAPDAEALVGHAGIPDLCYPEKLCHNSYTAPMLGSDSMPLLRLQQPPPYEGFEKQVSNHLPEHLHQIPPPAYAFSQNTSKFCPTASMTGAVPGPPRTMNSILPNNMYPAPESAEPFEVEMGEGRTFSEFGAEGMPRAQCDILQESAPSASRWAWFANKELSAHGDDIENFELRTVDQQLSGQYDHRIHAGCWLREDQGGLSECHEKDKVFRAKLAHIDDWMIHQFVNTIAQPYEWDMTTKGFQSGDLPCSGLAFEYQEFPPDLGYDPIALHYGPIDWEAIPAPRLNQPSYMQHTIFNQTSQGSMDHEIAKAAAKSRPHLESIELKKRVFKQRKAIEEGKARARTRADTSYRSSYDHYFGVHGKIYIRPISFRVDVRAMHRIYNWHVTRSIDVPETENISMKELIKSIEASARQGYPCLVAVLRADPGDPPIARALDFTQDGTDTDEPTEHVVGFTLCKSWTTNRAHAFQDIADVSVFVSPQYVGRKIATNLLDRTIGCIDRDYPSKQGAQIRVSPDGPAWNRGWREPQTICMRWFFDDMAAPQNIGRKVYLEDHFGFVETGRLLNALSKDGNKTRYSMITMQREANRLPRDDSEDDQDLTSGPW